MEANVVEIKRKESSAIEELKATFKAQKEAFANNCNPSQQDRAADIHNLKRGLLKYKSRLSKAMSEDFSCRGVYENIGADITTPAMFCDYNKKMLSKWMKPGRRKLDPLTMPGSARVIHQPLGVVGIIAPWNYPVSMAATPLSAALAAGNRVMIKMSEFTPRTAEVFKEMIASVFSEDKVAIVTGEADVGKAFSEQPWDHLLFTGATSIGRHVMAAAAKNLTPVTLELGGKSPTIVGSSVDLEDAAQKITFGKMLNAGQTCIAPDYVLVQENKYSEFIKAIKDTASKFHRSIADNEQYTAIVSDRQHQRLMNVIADAKAKGAEVIEINPSNDDLSNSRKIPLHLVLNATDDMLVLQDEIFGPILPILKYSSVTEAIKYVNDRPHPLALYVFDKNSEHVDAVCNQTLSGGVCVNDAVMHVSVHDLPFGGVGPSGMGSYHGKEGFVTFSHAKSIYTRGFFNTAKITYPPYNKGLGSLVIKALKR